MPPNVPAFLVGLLVVPVAKKMFKPLLRGVIKTSIEVIADARQAAHSVGEELQDIAAEVTAEMTASRVVDAEVPVQGPAPTGQKSSSTVKTS